MYIYRGMYTDIQIYTNGGKKVLLVLSDEAYVSTHMYMHRSIYVDIHWRGKDAAGALLMQHMYLHVCIYTGVFVDIDVYMVL